MFQELVELIRTKKLAQAAAASAKKNWRSELELELVVKSVRCTEKRCHMRVIQKLFIIPPGYGPSIKRCCGWWLLEWALYVAVTVESRCGVPSSCIEVTYLDERYSPFSQYRMWFALPLYYSHICGLVCWMNMSLCANYSCIVTVCFLLPWTVVVNDRGV